MIQYNIIINVNISIFIHVHIDIMINANISKWPLKILLRLLFTLALDDVPLAFASSQMIYALVWLGWIAWPFLWQKDQHLSHMGVSANWQHSQTL